MYLHDDEPDEPPMLDLVPMMDVILTILTFFIFSTLFLTRSEGLPVNLPKAATAESQQRAKITVTLDEQGQVFLNKRAIELNELSSTVKSTMRATPDLSEAAVVVINADESVDHGQVIAVMDQLRDIEGVTLGIATKQPEKGESDR